MAKESGKRLVPDMFVTGDEAMHPESSSKKPAGDTELQDDEHRNTEISTIEVDETLVGGSMCEDKRKTQDKSPVESKEEDKSQGDRHNHPAVQAAHSSMQPTGEADVQELTVEHSDSGIESKVVEKSPGKNDDKQNQEKDTGIKDEGKCTTMKNTAGTKQGSSSTPSNLLCKEEAYAVEAEDDEECEGESDECDDEQTEDEDDDTNESESEDTGDNDNDDNSEMEETSEIETERTNEDDSDMLENDELKSDNEDLSNEAEVDFTIRLLVRRNSDNENNESESSGEPFSEELVPFEEPYKPREVSRDSQLESDLQESEQKDGEDNKYGTTKDGDNDTSDDVIVEEFLVFDPPYNPDKKKDDVNLKAKDEHYGNKLGSSPSSSTETLVLYDPQCNPGLINTEHEKDNGDNDKNNGSGCSNIIVIDENVGNGAPCNPEEGDVEHKLDDSDDDDSLTSVETVIECDTAKKINKENDESDGKDSHSESEEDHAIANDDFDHDEGEATADDAASIEDMEATNGEVYSDESSDEQTRFDHPDTEGNLEPPTKKAKSFN